MDDDENEEMLTARRPLGGRNDKEERLGKSGAEHKAGRSERFRD